MPATATLILSNDRTRQRAVSWVMTAEPGTILTFEKPARTLPQNARLHAMITDVARQVEWAGAKRTVEAWKDIFTAALRSAGHDLDVVPGINGGFVLLGMHTSRMTKAELGDLMTLVESFAAEHGVTLSDPTHEPSAAREPASVKSRAGAAA